MSDAVLRRYAELWWDARTKGNRLWHLYNLLDDLRSREHADKTVQGWVS